MNADNLRPENGADDAIRRLLNDAVSDVEPHEGLDSIRGRTVRSIHSKRPWLLGAGAAVVATAATIAAVAAIGNNPGTTTSPEPPPFVGSESASPDPTGVDSGSPEPTKGTSPDQKPTEPEQTPPTTVNAPVYYLGEVTRPSEGGEPVTELRLYREWHQVSGNDSPATLAVREMLTAPAADADYSSAWAEDADVRSVSHEGGEITVDLTGPVQEANVGAEAAQISVQQLVYTVQAALSASGDENAVDPVRITLDGQPVESLWGHVDTSEPVARAEKTGTQAPIWVTAPADGTTVESPVQIKGIAQVFEANVNWRLLRDGTVVDESFATTDKGAPAFGNFQFTLPLQPGSYTIEVFELSAMDGSETYLDSKTFTVR